MRNKNNACIRCRRRIDTGNTPTSLFLVYMKGVWPTKYSYVNVLVSQAQRTYYIYASTFCFVVVVVVVVPALALSPLGLLLSPSSSTSPSSSPMNGAGCQHVVLLHIVHSDNNMMAKDHHNKMWKRVAVWLCGMWTIARINDVGIRWRIDWLTTSKYMSSTLYETLLHRWRWLALVCVTKLITQRSSVDTRSPHRTILH